jgi:hypothetical protein
MKTNHTLIRLHNLDADNANRIAEIVRSFMGNYRGHNFDCTVVIDEKYLDIIASCSDQDEPLAHACAWGASVALEK